MESRLQAANANEQARVKSFGKRSPKFGFNGLKAGLHTRNAFAFRVDHTVKFKEAEYVPSKPGMIQIATSRIAHAKPRRIELH